MIKHDKCHEFEAEIEKLSYFKAAYNILIDGAARDTEKINELQTENKKLREALLECPIVGEIHRDSNERFKEWNLIHRNTIREALKEVEE